MARISESVIAGLANPSFGKGLFTAGKAIGSSPQMMREKAKKEKRAGMLSGIPAGDTPAGTISRLQMLSKFATEDGDYAQAAAYTKQANDEIARLREVNLVQGQRDQLKASALYKARQAENPEQEIQRVLNMTDAQRVAYTTPKDPLVVAKGSTVLSGDDPTQVLKKPEQDPITTSSGQKVYVKDDKGNFIEVAYNKPVEKTTVLPDGAFLIGPDNQVLVQNMRDLDQTENQGLGELSAKVEEAAQEANEIYTKNSNGYERALDLLADFAVDPDRAAGVFGSIKTATYKLLGLTDKNEQQKIQAIREINTDIVNSLPPGVASDTDIEIFSRGFPDNDANPKQIMAYLRVSAAAQAYAADRALLFDKYLMDQREAGISPSSAGSTSRVAEYQNIFDVYVEKIESGEMSRARATEEMGKIFGVRPLAFRFVQEPEETTTP